MIIKKEALEFMWNTEEPFLFLVHHQDHYPAGNDRLGPEDVSGRHMGNDFDLKNDWRMYHGMAVPGFPKHPHRGFETVTMVLEGYVDHHDSMGNRGRYGPGDVQWMTAGRGMMHSEMFPLLDSESDNPLHLFQLWLNLDQKHKMVQPGYEMMWAESIPVLSLNETRVKVVSGQFHHVRQRVPENSWAYGHRVDIFLVSMSPGGHINLEDIPENCHRNLYLYEGNLKLGDEVLAGGFRYKMETDSVILASQEGAKFLILQGEPIDEPIAKGGPFVMNTQAEIDQAFSDFRKTQFGGWPWEDSEPVLPRDQARFFQSKNTIDKP